MADLLNQVKSKVGEAKYAAKSALGLASRQFGPMLHFRGRHGNNWHVSAVAAADEGINVELAAAAHKQGESSFRLEGGCKPVVFQCMDLVVPMANASQLISYSCKFGDESASSFTFVTPAASQDPNVMYFSCNDTPMKRNREKPEFRGKQYGAWKWLCNNFEGDENQKKPETLHLIIGGGDNIYADDVFLLVAAHDNYGTILDFYVGEYIRRFNTEDIHMAQCIATVPTFMQCDDHDYYNGFGSFTDNRRLHGQCNKAAHVARFAFQLGMPSAAKVEGIREVLDNATRVVRLGPQVAMLSLDMRSNRNVDKKTLMPVDEVFVPKLQEAEAMLKDDETKHLIVLFAAPVIWQHDTMAEILAQVMKNVPVAAIFASDRIDEMRSSNNVEETTLILHKLFLSAQQNNVRLTFISGDVHNAGYGTVRAKGITDENDFRYAQQWISSPICNVPDEVTGLELMQKKLSKSGDKKDPDVDFEFSADPNGKEGKLVAQLDTVWTNRRNFLIFKTQRENLCGQLYLNKEGSEEEFEKTPDLWVAKPTRVTASTQGEGGGCCVAM